MAEPIMENPLAPESSSAARPPLAHFTRVIQDVKDCINEIKQEFEDSGGIPINDDIQPLHRFCAKLEFILQGGLKAKSSLLGGKKDYWNYFWDCLSSNKSLNDGLRFVKTVSEIKTNLGRGRAFLRFALMHQRLADTIQQCVQNGKVTQEWYLPKALWFHPKLVSELINALYDLNDVQFDLSPRGYDLDASWPSFARRTFGAPYSWKPPSRTTSISSLASIPTMDSVTTPTPSPQPAMDPETMKLKVDLSVTEAEKLSGEKQLELREKEISDLKSQLADTQKKSNEFEVKCDKVANELKLKEVAWEAREKALQKSVVEAKAETPDYTDGGFDLVEARGKLTASEKRNQALRIDVQRLEIELKAKAMVDGKKTELIELLERKVKQMEGKLTHVMNLAEEAIKDKEDQARKLASASDTLVELQDRLAASEKANHDIKYMNVELKGMLNSLEGKGKKMADMALDKVRQFSADNKSMKEESVKLKDENTASKARIVDLQRSLDENCAEILKQITALVAAPGGDKGNEEGKKAMEELLARMQNLEDTTKASHEAAVKENESLSSALQEAESKNTELQVEIESLKEQAQAVKPAEKAVETPVSAPVPASAPAATPVQGQGLETQSDNGQLAAQVKAQEAQMDQMRSEMNAIKNLLLQKLQNEVAAASSDKKPCELSYTQSDCGVLDAVGQLLDRYESLRDEIRSVESRNQDLTEKLTSRERVVDELTQAVDTLTLGKAALEVQLSQSSGEQEALTITMQEKVSLLEEKIQEFEELCAANDELRVKLKQLEDCKTALDSDIETKNCSITELTDKVQSLSDDLTHLRNSHDAVAAEKQTLQNQIIATENKMAEMEEQFEGILRELEMTKDEKGGLILQKEELRNENEQLQMERLGLVCKAESAEDKLHQLLEEQEHQQRELEKAVHVRQDSEKETSGLIDMLTAKELEFQEILKKRDSSAEDDAKQIARLHSQCEEATATVSKLAKECADLKSALTSQGEKVGMLERNVNSLTSANSSLEDKCKELQTALERNKEELILSEKNMTEQEAKAKEFNYEFISLKNQLDGKCHELDEVRDTLGQRENDVFSSREAIGGLEKEKDKLHVQNLQLRTSLNDLRQKIRDLEVESGIVTSTEVETAAECDLSSIKVDEDAVDCSTHTGVLIPELKVDNDKLRDRIKAILSAKDEMCRTLTTEKAVFQDELGRIKDEFEDKAKQLEDAEMLITELKEKLENTNSDVTGKTEAIETLMRNMELGREEVNKLKESLIASEKALEDLRVTGTKDKADMTSKMEELKAEMTRKDAEWSALKEGLVTEVTSLRFERSSEQMQMQEVVKTQQTTDLEIQNLEDKTSRQEALIEEMEIELKNTREDREVETETFVSQIKELKEGLDEQTNESLVLGKELRSTNITLMEERKRLKTMESELKSTKQQMSDLEAKYKSELELANSDIKGLKQKVIKLVRDKDALWQKTDRLVFQQKLRSTDKWQQSDEVSLCLGCHAEFSLILRKHHCRLCGRIFCKECCDNWVTTPHSSKKERVCKECVMSHSQLETTSEGGSDHEESDLMESVQIPERRSTKWSESGSVSILEDSDASETDPRETSAEVFAPVGHSSMTSHPGDDVTASAGDEPTGSPLGEDAGLDERRLLSMTDDNKSKSSGALVVPGEDEEEEGATAPVATQSPDEIYDVITDEEIMQSITEPLPDPSVSTHPTVMSDQILKGEVRCLPELWIKAGKSYAIPVFIERPGVTLCWTFITQPKGIEFLVTYKENDYVPSDCCETLVPLCRCNSHKEPVCGELTARKSGVYTLTFDNRASRFTSKKLEYTLSIQGSDDT